MGKQENRPLALRLINSVCAFALIGAVVYMIIAGFEMAAMGVAAVALVGVAAPLVTSGDGIVEILVGIIEAIFEGVVGVFAAVFDFFSGLFG